MVHIHVYTHTHTHTHTEEYYSVIEKNEILSLATTWMALGYTNLLALGYTNWNKSNRKRQVMHDFTYMWNIKKQSWRNKQINRYREQTGGCQRGEGWVKQVREIKWYKLIK